MNLRCWFTIFQKRTRGRARTLKMWREGVGVLEAIASQPLGGNKANCKL